MWLTVSSFWHYFVLLLLNGKNAMCCFQQILEAVLPKISTVRPLTSHLKNYPSKKSKTCGTLLEKQRRIHKWRFSMDPLHMDTPVLVDQQ